MRVATVGNGGGVWEELSGEILQGPQCPDSKGWRLVSLHRLWIRGKNTPSSL